MTPGHPALIGAGEVRTYAELAENTTRLAHGLAARGVSRGDRVAFLGLNSIELVEAMFAAAKLGAVFIPLNTRLAPPEAAYILTDSGTKLLIAAPGFEDVISAPRVRRLPVDVVPADAVRRDGPGGLRSEHTTPVDEPVGHDDLFMIQYTSGTTGRPKGVMLTHGNIIWNVYNLLVDVDIRSDEIALVTAPLFHTAALNQVLFPTLVKGGTALIEAKFDPDRAIGLIEEHGVTLLLFLEQPAQRARERRLSSTTSRLASLAVKLSNHCATKTPLSGGSCRTIMTAALLAAGFSGFLPEGQPRLRLPVLSEPLPGGSWPSAWRTQVSGSLSVSGTPA